jgi:putative ABC transport system permease protein
MRAVREQLATSEPPVMVVKQRAFHARMLALSGSLPKLLSRVALVFALSTLLVVFSNALVSQRERRSEFGALLAIGFSRARLFALIMGEALVVAIIASLLGCGVPFVALYGRGIRLGEMALERVVLDGFVCLEVFLGGALLVCLASVIPALLLIRTKVTILLEDR